MKLRSSRSQVFKAQVGKSLNLPTPSAIFDRYDSFIKLGVDAPLDLSIIRPTSGADETENSLIIKELDEVSSEECFGSDA